MHGITHLLSSQQDQIGSEDSEKGHSCTWHRFTHSLSIEPHAKIERKDGEKACTPLELAWIHSPTVKSIVIPGWQCK